MKILTALAVLAVASLTATRIKIWKDNRPLKCERDHQKMNRDLAKGLEELLEDDEGHTSD
ncbi:hypothetical protein KAR91_47170 [Candidatus Pacearchaeota archaeon]|nr:hypothetical protein [Candidatus Pacearchaeota archaeon]